MSINTNINGIAVTGDTAITFVKNPKRAGSKAADRYEIYSFASTIDELAELNSKQYLMPDMRYDHGHGFLQIVEIVEPEPEAEIKIEEVDPNEEVTVINAATAEIPEVEVVTEVVVPPKKSKKSTK